MVHIAGARRLDVEMFKTRPLTSACARVLRRRQHVIIGISPFNSYFSERTIARLLRWSSQEFHAFHAFVPDEPAAYTLEAIGYSPARARRKARRQSNWLKNKIGRALEELDRVGASCENVILDSRRLGTNPMYMQGLAAAHRAYESDPEFRAGCHASAEWVIGRSGSDAAIDDVAVRTAARYLLAEVPLFVGTPAIVGTSSSVFCYHQTIPFLKDLFERRFSVPVSDEQGFVEVVPDV